MSNGSYEVIHWIDNGVGEIGKPFWVKPEEILYEIDTEQKDNLDNYFEFIFNEDGLHIVPKNIDLIEIDADGDLKNNVLKYKDTKHETVTIYVGDTVIKDENKLCETPKDPTFGDKIKTILTGDETSNNNQEGPENEKR
jgi:hypothetical protein